MLRLGCPTRPSPRRKLRKPAPATRSLVAMQSAPSCPATASPLGCAASRSGRSPSRPALPIRDYSAPQSLLVPFDLTLQFCSVRGRENRLRPRSVDRSTGDSSAIPKHFRLLPHYGGVNLGSARGSGLRRSAGRGPSPWRPWPAAPVRRAGPSGRRCTPCRGRACRPRSPRG